MGACSSKPKTAEFEGVVNCYPDGLQIESETKSLNDKLQGCKDRFESIVMPQHRVISECSIQNPSSVENTHGYVQDALLESDNKPLAGISLGHNENTSIQDVCDDHLAVQEPDNELLPSTVKIDPGYNTSKFQKEKLDTQTLKSPGISEAGAGRAVKSRESQTLGKPVNLANDTTPIHDLDASQIPSAPIINKINVSEWTTLNFATLSTDGAGISEVIGSDTESLGRSQPHLNYFTTETVRAGEELMVGTSSHLDFSTSVVQLRATQHQMHLQKVQLISNMSNGLQNHLQNITKPLLATAVENVGGGDVGRSSHAFTANSTGVESYHMARGSEPDMIPQDHDGTHVFARKESSALNSSELSVTEKSSANQNKLNNIPQEDHASKQGLHVMEPVELKTDIITDMDQMLEKLASEFERQESLSSYSLKSSNNKFLL